MLFTGDSLPGAGSRPGGLPLLYYPALYEETLARLEKVDFHALCLGHHYISLAPSNTEILFALGLVDSVVGVTDYETYPPEALQKPSIGGFSTPNMEKIIALEPDLILGTGIHVKTTLPELEKRGLTVMIVDPRDVKAVMEKIRLVGRATGQQHPAEQLAGGMQTRIEALQMRLRGVQPVRVFFELSPSLHTAGPGSFVDDMIRLAEGTNIAAGTGKEWPQLNQEAVFLADPEVILLADHGSAGETPERVAARAGWQQISAVKTGRVHGVDPDLTNRPGPRMVDGLESMAKLMHPEKFR